MLNGWIGRPAHHDEKMDEALRGEIKKEEGKE